MSSKNKKPKYTKREKHLLFVIASLRGSASDAWARLNFIFARRPRDIELDEAIMEHARLDELAEGEEQLRTPFLGAGLPWFRPQDMQLDVACEQEKVLDKRARWSKKKLINSGAPK